MFHEPAAWCHGHIGPAHLERARLVAAVRQCNRRAARIALEYYECRMDEQDRTSLCQRRDQRHDRQQQQYRASDFQNGPRLWNGYGRPNIAELVSLLKQRVPRRAYYFLR